MSSWQIIKEFFIKGKNRKTLGYTIAIQEASKLFFQLLMEQKVEKEAKDEFNKDEEVKEAILLQKQVDELRESGILQ